jgi:FAD/FMN-containing dehydrogenase/Fe-S oxidoreductase
MHEDIFIELKENLEGEIFSDNSSRLIYATDASVYREIPMAVALPKGKEDIKTLIRFAQKNQKSLIPRTAGTSLAGQVVGSGIVVDVSRHMNRILEINPNERWVKVEPGVVLDELNQKLLSHGLFFAPETSTSNRCMIGGMVGNNSCGAHSLIYGSTRDHVLEIETILSDGNEVVFKELSKEEFEEKCNGDAVENQIYRNIKNILSDPFNREEIIKNYPDPDLERRNTGYALDLLLHTSPFEEKGKPFNFCRLLTGSEGTLAFTTSVKLNLLPLPPPVTGLLCVHFKSLEDALVANLIALEHDPGSIELMDDVIMNCTRENLSQKHNRIFIEGDPKAILIIEWARNSLTEIEKLAADTENALRNAGLGYHFPLITGPDQKKVWNLRKAGLGVLTNIPGDAKPTGLIEDTAVKPELLPEYIREFKEILSKYNLSCVYYAHIATGELHIKPVLNLKILKDYELFSQVALETAQLVKKYRGSLSGEHGDGRLRGQFIPLMLGEHNYKLLSEVKKCWDPAGIFNSGKITDTPPMNTALRYSLGEPKPEIKTLFDYSKTQGWLRAVEQCNGSADCRKSVQIGGIMCPSYMATGDEKNTTRARANLMREFLTNPTKVHPYANQELYDILDLCLSCKGCKVECPSGVDMARYKAEFLQGYYDVRKVPFRIKRIADITKTYRLFSGIPVLFNVFAKSSLLSLPLKKILGFASKRTFPKLSSVTLRKWVHKNPGTGNGKKVYLFADEFTNHTDAEIGIKAVKLLRVLGYNPQLADHNESGRVHISKGLLRKARLLAEENITALMLFINNETPLIGIEPSAILCFRDEYPDLVNDEYKEVAKNLSENCFTIEEFIIFEFEKGNIKANDFTDAKKDIKFHGHCYQKALTTTDPTKKMLEIPLNFKAEEIPSGCCGMAGSFGFEKEHFELSNKIGELVLFPSVRNSTPDTIIAASGTSCRHHIKDGTGVTAIHPIEVLYNALVKETKSI